MEEPPVAVVVDDPGNEAEVLVEVIGTLRWIGRLACANTSMLIPVMGYVLYRVLVPSC